MRHHDVPDLTSSDLTAEFLASQDAILIATDHTACDYNFIVEHASLVVDTRNATADVKSGREKIRKA
jgi:UDP-N-acetyl-D-glucosamine dehydrogenase